MEKIVIPRSKSSPEVIMDYDNGLMEIIGESLKNHWKSLDNHWETIGKPAGKPSSTLRNAKLLVVVMLLMVGAGDGDG